LAFLKLTVAVQGKYQMRVAVELFGLCCSYRYTESLT
jgi:hypothetical protein